MSTKPVLAWHFTGDTLRDGRPIPEIGKRLVHRGQLVMCQSGLHASVHPLDALTYAPGHLLHRVRCSGRVVHDGDKLVCSVRVIEQSRDVEKLLRRYAKDQALTVIDQWNAPAVVREYLRGDDESLRDAAWAAAWDAARDAARYAARDAARSAARYAARDAAWDAAWAAAWDAARPAAWDAARSAAWDAARSEFKSRVLREFGIRAQAR